MKKNFRSEKKFSSPETREIIDGCKGLVYISETDAPLEPFTIVGSDKDILDAIVEHFKIKVTIPIETRDTDQFFSRLTVVKEWFGDREKQTAKRFAELQSQMTGRLAGLTVIRAGEIRIDIYVAGKTATGEIVGFKTLSVET